MLEVFDVKLKEAIHKLPFDKILTLKNVRNTINEADGYQPHIIAPEAGYRRLIEDGLTLLRDPCEWQGCRACPWQCKMHALLAHQEHLHAAVVVCNRRACVVACSNRLTKQAGCYGLAVLPATWFTDSALISCALR